MALSSPTLPEEVQLQDDTVEETGQKPTNQPDHTAACVVDELAVGTVWTQEDLKQRTVLAGMLPQLLPEQHNAQGQAGRTEDMHEKARGEVGRSLLNHEESPCTSFQVTFSRSTHLTA